MLFRGKRSNSARRPSRCHSTLSARPRVGASRRAGWVRASNVGPTARSSILGSACMGGDFSFLSLTNSLRSASNSASSRLGVGSAHGDLEAWSGRLSVFRWLKSWPAAPRASAQVPVDSQDASPAPCEGRVEGHRFSRMALMFVAWCSFCRSEVALIALRAVMPDVDTRCRWVVAPRGGKRALDVAQNR